MALNINDIRTKRREIQAEAQRGNLWFPGKGANRIRLAVWNSPVTGKTEFYREVRIHQAGKKAPVNICGTSASRDGARGQSCPHCEQYEAIRAAEGKEKAQPFKSKKRYIFVAVPIEKSDQPFRGKKPYQFSAAQTVGEAILKIVGECDEVKDVNEYFGPRGLDFKINFDPDAPPMTMYSVKVLPQNKSEPLDPALFNGIETALDPFGSDNWEPAAWLAAQGRTVPMSAEDSDGAAAPAPAAPAPAPVQAAAGAASQVAVAASPAAAAAPQPGFLTVEQATAHVAQPGLEGWKVAVDPDGDAYFIAPDGKATQYEAPPVPVAAPPKAKKAPPPPPAETPAPGATPPGNFSTPEAQMAARGMKVAEKPVQAPPDDSQDAATDDEG